MTQPRIVEKLRNILRGDVDSECKVVYVLAESRKLLETYPPDPKPFALKLYCHWALHTELDHPSVTLPFLEGADRFAASVVAGNSNVVEEHRILREFVFLDTFQQQFRQLLQAYNLPAEICDDKQRWHEFLKHYAGVIEDGSLGVRLGKEHRLKLVKAVGFTKGRNQPGFYIPFSLVWTIRLQDERILEVEVKASAPQGREMICYGIRLHPASGASASVFDFDKFSGISIHREGG